MEHIRNLIRVLKTVPDDRFNISYFWDSYCGCALGHALQDDYFYHNGFNISKLEVPDISKFFGITERQADDIFFSGGYPWGYAVMPRDVIAKLEALLVDDSPIVVRELEDA